VKRKDWEFTFTVETVLEAAKAKHEFHKARLAYWTQLYEIQKAKYKESGFVVDDSFGGSNTSYRQVHVEFDQATQRKMEDAKLKLTEHEVMASEYGAFVTALTQAALGSSHTELPLQYDDIVYFGIGAEVFDSEIVDEESEDEEASV
jgi:hypothetical protein